jgi:hypothetical protein
MVLPTCLYTAHTPTTLHLIPGEQHHPYPQPCYERYNVVCHWQPSLEHLEHSPPFLNVVSIRQSRNEATPQKRRSLLVLMMISHLEEMPTMLRSTFISSRTRRKSADKIGCTETGNRILNPYMSLGQRISVVWTRVSHQRTLSDLLPVCLLPCQYPPTVVPS